MDAVYEIADALAAGTDTSVLLTDFVKSYGTHVIFSVTYGGSAQLVVQMSVHEQSSLANEGYDIAAQGAAAFWGAEVTANGSYTSNNTAYQNIKQNSASFETLLFPSTVNLPVDSNGMVQCQSWSQGLAASNTNGIYQPVRLRHLSQSRLRCCSSAVAAGSPIVLQ
jgi:hypothetical protein